MPLKIWGSAGLALGLKVVAVQSPGLGSRV